MCFGSRCLKLTFQLLFAPERSGDFPFRQGLIGIMMTEGNG